MPGDASLYWYCSLSFMLVQVQYKLPCNCISCVFPCHLSWHCSSFFLLPLSFLSAFHYILLSHRPSSCQYFSHLPNPLLPVRLSTPSILIASSVPFLSLPLFHISFPLSSPPSLLMFPLPCHLWLTFCFLFPFLPVSLTYHSFHQPVSLFLHRLPTSTFTFPTYTFLLLLFALSFSFPFREGLKK